MYIHELFRTVCFDRNNSIVLACLFELACEEQVSGHAVECEGHVLSNSSCRKVQLSKVLNEYIVDSRCLSGLQRTYWEVESVGVLCSICSGDVKVDRIAL